MDIEIETSLKELKNNFIIIGGIREDISQTFQMVELVISELNDIYGEYIKHTKDNMMVFGLNPFYFQCKLVKLEYDDMHRFYISITNRMYCEYYKLHKIMAGYITETVKENDSLKVNFMYKEFPVYKDLEPFKEYDFEIICKIHDVIITMIDYLFQYLVKKENHMKTNENKNKTGLFINNFVNTLNYDIIVMREKILLFIHDLGFFHKLHIQYLKRFSDKILFFHMQLNDDVKLNSNTKPKLPAPVSTSPVSTTQNNTFENKIVLSMKEIQDDFPKPVVQNKQTISSSSKNKSNTKNENLKRSNFSTQDQSQTVTKSKGSTSWSISKK
jgi:hypothetical protein